MGLNDAQLYTLLGILAALNAYAFVIFWVLMRRFNSHVDSLVSDIQRTS